MHKISLHIFRKTALSSFPKSSTSKFSLQLSHYNITATKLVFNINPLLTIIHLLRNRGVNFPFETNSKLLLLPLHNIYYPEYLDYQELQMRLDYKCLDFRLIFRWYLHYASFKQQFGYHCLPAKITPQLFLKGWKQIIYQQEWSWLKLSFEKVLGE